MSDNHPGTKKVIAYFLIVVILIGTIIIGIFLGCVLCADIYNKQVDDYFSMIYESQVVDDGRSQVYDILTKVSNSYDQAEMSSNIGLIFEDIAEWETENYTNILVEIDNCGSSSVKSIGTYKYDANGLIRAQAKPYRHDPFWIAHYRYGACGELAALFAYVVNQLGFETRVVRADYADGSNNHAWVEINVNNEWFFADPTLYWEITKNNATWYTDPWYGPTEDFKIFGKKVKAVVIDGTDVDVRFHYPNANYPDKTISKTELLVKKSGSYIVIGSAA